MSTLLFRRFGPTQSLLPRTNDHFIVKIRSKTSFHLRGNVFTDVIHSLFQTQNLFQRIQNRVGGHHNIIASKRSTQRSFQSIGPCVSVLFTCHSFYSYKQKNRNDPSRHCCSDACRLAPDDSKCVCSDFIFSAHFIIIIIILMQQH